MQRTALRAAADAETFARLRRANQTFDLTFCPVNRALHAHCQGKKSVNWALDALILGNYWEAATRGMYRLQIRI